MTTLLMSLYVVIGVFIANGCRALATMIPSSGPTLRTPKGWEWPILAVIVVAWPLLLLAMLCRKAGPTIR